MPKKRKTRKQKIITDTKKHVVSEMILPVTATPLQSTQHVTPQSPKTGTFTLPTLSENPTQKPHTTKLPITVSLSEYGYLPTDLLRTAVLCGAIVVTELLIRFIFVH